MDYFYQFLVGFAATAIGVILALILERWYDQKKEVKEANDIKVKLLAELRSIRISMLDIHNQNGKTLLISPIKMPIFQGLTTSAKVSLLDRYFWYKDLLSLYKYLDTYNSWQDAKTEKIIRLSDLPINLHIDSPIGSGGDKFDILNAINQSLTNLEEIVLGKHYKSELSEECNVCSNKICDWATDVGLISCMLQKLSTTAKSDISQRHSKRAIMKKRQK